jgi:hypothetical protein
MTGKRAWAVAVAVVVATAVFGSGCRSTSGEPRPSRAERNREARAIRAERNRVARANLAPAPEAPTQPRAAVNLSAFQAVGLTALIIAPPYDGSNINKRAAARIELVLLAEMRGIFPQLKVGAEAEGVKADAGEALLIEPLLTEVRFIGGGARFMAGAMAGNSNVRLRVTFRNAKTGAVVAEPEFYRVGNAMAGAWTVGGSDNVMLDNLAREVSAYVRQNL